METPLRGRCQCGAVEHTVSADPLFTYACHCYNCQKRTGSAFSMGLVVATESLEVKGPLVPWSRVSDEGDTNTRCSCADCGNIIYGIGDTNPELAKLQAGTLDDTSDVEPDVHLWTCRKQSWVRLPEGASVFETQPEDAAALFQAALDYRGRKHGTTS
jgi:hypothetical protein